jgi:hypothetical protein
MPKIREIARTASNSDRFSAAGRIANRIYDDILGQVKEKLPNIYKETVNIAKTFPKKANEMEPLARFINQTWKPAAGVMGLGYLMNKILGRKQTSD